MKKGLRIASLALAGSLLGTLCACGEEELKAPNVSEEWFFDESYHWQIDLDTGEEVNKDIHNYVKGVCHLCGYSPNAQNEPEYYTVTYSVDGTGGSIAGDRNQRIKNGEDGTPVQAVPDENFLFVMWSDGEIDPDRQELAVKKNMRISAIFEPDPEAPDFDDDGEYGNDHEEEPEPDNEKVGQSDEENGLIFTEIRTLTDDVVTGYSVRKGASLKSDVKIPKKHKELPVLKIEDNAFSKSGIVSIEIPDSVTKIGHQAFMDCGSLRSVVIPDSVLDVGNQAFQNCWNLQTVKLSASMEGVWYKMFFNCQSLTEIELPDSIQSIGRYAFYNCTSLTRIKFGTGNRKCGAKAFQNCKNIQTVEITDIRAWCETTFDFFMLSLKSTFESNPVYYSHSITFEGKPLENLVIPDETKMINSYAFMGCETLKTVKIPGSVKVIGKMVFLDCKELETVEIEEGVISMQYGVFMRCSKLKSLSLPDSIETICKDPEALEKTYSPLVETCGELTEVRIGKGFKDMDFILCTGCKKLSRIIFSGTEAEWRAYERYRGWISQCANPLTVHCEGSNSDIVYREVWTVEGYVRFPVYKELSEIQEGEEEFQE